MRCRCVPNGADVLMLVRSAEKGHLAVKRPQRPKDFTGFCVCFGFWNKRQRTVPPPFEFS